ncbi:MULTISPECIES: apotyrosinase chaperone MelC1 [Streptomyces]|uniref:Tyrosinase cofactor n=1 Tax=Streptomyces caniscabiei TaxID=2746961 RepID=A0ABU4MS71_9ACTN|nr:MULTISPECIES: tyrosinase cofactor [Streptomyces]MBE4737458.1 tyrosinase [Streptomyces caniscabiei]MBE4756218.1 tyrosinase [Streptomyces caniscabiei]MBE4769765.1 tyrosinase [Streptomyces caniscabiei]MBE4787289.1 tyrosinase [Streptomyces caniscabiei]MBE4795306.1 tyrosinase [Streptomyces caniscabiei]
MPDITRRHALGAAAALAVTVGAPLTAAAADDHGSHEGHGDHDGHQGLQPFDEVYRGRRIQGRPTEGGGHHHGTGYAVFVDEAELHVMRNADGSWISVVSHYSPVPTPRAAARAAVDELQGARLVPFS